MRYAALLRGINVGGKNKVDMKLLKQVVEKAGMGDVKTYINSGNLVFSYANHSTKDLARTFEKAIFEDFGLRIHVLVYRFEEYEKIVQAIPPNWTNDQQMKSDVLFLWEEVDHESILTELTIKPEIDRVKYVPGAILWSVDRQQAAKSGMMKLVGTKPYKLMTVRNVNTVRKIYGLMRAGRCQTDD